MSLELVGVGNHFNQTGLSSKEAENRLKLEGYNELTVSKKRHILKLIFDIAKEPMIFLLIACGVVYLFLGDTSEAVLLMASIGVIFLITFFQERRTEKALEALRDLSSPRALVVRDGQTKRIAGRDVVRGDIIIISEGDRVPADSAIINTDHLGVDESLLTGESVPVEKIVWDGEQKIERPGQQSSSFIYSSTLVTSGRAVAEVLSIGSKTEVGRIGKSLVSLQPEQTLLQKEVSLVVKRFATWSGIICAVVVLSYGLSSRGWLDGLLSGLALAISLLPEEFPVVLTVFMAIGAWRLSHRNVLTRQMPVIETLGSVTVLCVDKTGTLTQNRMTISALAVDGSILNIENNKLEGLDEKYHNLVEYAVLASHRDPFDPMEQAIREFGFNTLAQTEHWHANWELKKQYPLSSKLMAMSMVWSKTSTDYFAVACKGATEAVIDLCHLSSERSTKILNEVEELAKQGMRVLAVARTKVLPDQIVESQHDLDFEFLGLLAFKDPIRLEVRSALQECYGAGIRTIMITGDYPSTAKVIASDIGLKSFNGIITGEELDIMTDEELTKKIKEVSIFARVVPEQKLRIVQALKANDEIVVMTGDGVNDAPSLKAAHVGVAMGERGTDVAREAAAIVLLDDNFTSIVNAIKQGRTIFDNLLRAMSYVIAMHIPIAGLALLPVLTGFPLILTPVLIVFIELVIDPTCSIVFEAESSAPNIMLRQPRKLKEKLFSRRVVTMSILQGVVILAICVFVYLLFAWFGRGVEYARTATFVTLIVSNISIIIATRRQKNIDVRNYLSNNKTLLWLIAGIAISLLSVVYVPILQTTFGFMSLQLIEVLFSLLAGVMSWFFMKILAKVYMPRSESF